MLSAIVVFVTTYAMILPAITLDKSRAAQDPVFKTVYSASNTDRGEPDKGGGNAAVAEESDDTGEEDDETADHNADPGDSNSGNDAENSGAGDTDNSSEDVDDGGAGNGNDAADPGQEDASDEVYDDASAEGGNEDSEEDAGEGNAAAYAEEADSDSDDRNGAEGSGEAGTAADAEEASTAATAVPAETELITEETELVYSDEEETYKVVVNFDKTAKLPVGVELQVREITKDSDPEAYEEYYERALEQVQEKYDEYTTMSFANFYDISFIYEGAQIEPQGEVKVRIEYETAVEVDENAEIEAIHFAKDEENGGEEKPEILESEKTVTEQAVEAVEFAAEQFSVYGIVGTTIEKKVLASDGHNYKITVTFGSDTGIPADAELEVTEILQEEGAYDEPTAYEILEQRTKEALGIDECVLRYARFFDISIAKDGERIQPARGSSVDVKIELEDMDECDAEADDMKVVHFAEDPTPKRAPVADADTIAAAGTPEQIGIDVDGDAISFTTDGFSAYAIVAGPESVPLGWFHVTSIDELAELGSMGLYMGHVDGYYFRNTRDGNSSRMGIGKTKPAQNYPAANAALYYFERIGTSNQFYLYCYADDGTTRQYVRNENNNSLLLRNGADAAAAGATAFTVKVDSERFTFNNGVWYINMQGGANGTRFCSYNSSSDVNNNMYIWYYADADKDPYELDGKTYGFMNWEGGVAGRGLMAEEGDVTAQGYSTLKAKSMTVMSTSNYSDQLFVPNDSDISMWTFRWISGDRYLLSTVVDGSTKYLRIGENGPSLVSETDSSCEIRVIPGAGARSTQICLASGNRTLTFSGSTDQGYSIGGEVGREWLYLVELSELTSEYIRTYSAEKISVSDPNLTNGSRVIVYTRVWNEETKKYEFYAIDHEGKLKRVFESGDRIEWTGDAVNTLLWDFVEYYWEGTDDPNYYYELYNEYGECYLAPQVTGAQILSDDTIGINLNGRKEGRYYTTIMAWDEEYYSYVGLKAVGDQIESHSRLDGLSDFYFAEMVEINVDDEPTTVPTVDNNMYGIKMRLIDIATRKEMSDFLGNDQGGMGTVLHQGLLSTDIGANGYPTAAGGSLKVLYSGATEVNHLFLQDTYNGTGYFEYDSAQNFATLNGTDFTVYKELATYDSSGGRFTLQHGQFLPFNTIKAGYFASVNKKNLYATTASSENDYLPDGDPRKYEQLYSIEHDGQKVDSYFAMELEASFTQTPNGKDDWGHDIIFEFTGDDDFWLYVDGELVIDLGGIHSAVPGKVNFSTGEVNVNGTDTTLRDLFIKNYKKRGHTQAEAEAHVADLFIQNDAGQWIFPEYSTHTMRIFYMERGAGASNLHMRFNLASVKPGTVELSKELSGVDTTESVLSAFAFQILYKTEDGTEKRMEYVPYAGEDAAEGYVIYKNTTQDVSHIEEFVVGDITYDDVFLLKAGETAEIKLPEEAAEYRIIECGINTDVFKTVTANGSQLAGTTDAGHPASAYPANRRDFGIGYDTTDKRARVKYDNEVDPDALRTVTITKKLFKEDGTTEIPYELDQTPFTFRLYLASEYDELDSAYIYTYHVRDADGNYCRWDAASSRFVSIGVKDYDEVPPELIHSISFTTSIYGTIAKVPADHVVELRNMLAGTKFKIEERAGEMPDGYSFQKYKYNGEDYSTEQRDGVVDTVVARETPEDPDPHVDICNIKGWGLRVKKVWSDADFMESREPTYFAVFIDHSEEGEEEDLTLVEGTVKQLVFDAKPQTLYWYFPRLVTDFKNYVIREVTLVGGSPVVDEEGNVTGFDRADPIPEGGDLVLEGTQKGEPSTSEYTYTVLYEEGVIEEGSNVRVDTTTNYRPGVILRKAKWDGTSPLAGAGFKLTDTGTEGEEITIGTFTSGKDGLITVAFLSDDVEYTLTETKAPQAYYGLQEPMTITLSKGTLTVGYEDPDYYEVTTESGMPTLIIKDRPYTFEAVKTDLSTGEPLEGVHFALHREVTTGGVTTIDLNPMPGYEDLVTDEDGLIPQIDNTLPAGKYELREKETPDGYQGLSSYLQFKISSAGKIILIPEKYPEHVTLEELTGGDSGEADDGTIRYVLTIPNVKQKQVSVWKTNEDHTAITIGATFALYHAEDCDPTTGFPVDPGKEPIMTGRTGANGLLRLGTLETGEYRLVETQAPEGYRQLTSAIRITVSDTSVTAFQGTGESEVARDDPDNPYYRYWVSGQPPGTWQIRVWNNSGYELPSTGGTGTFPYTVGGILLITIYVTVNMLRGRFW